MWREQQESFAAALLDPARPLPGDVANGGGQGASKRFDIYRNNVVVGLRQSLTATFPVVTALVGEEFFNAMAREFTLQSPPKSPVMIEYGDAFAGFIESFQPLSELPYLSDVARLEWAWSRAYHARDATPITVSELAGKDDGELSGLHFELHPSMQLLQSPWPVVAIWQAHQGAPLADALTDLASSQASSGTWTLIVRPDLEVCVRAVSETAFIFVDAFADGKPLGEALAMLAEVEDFDASVHLAELFDTGVVVGLA